MDVGEFNEHRLYIGLRYRLWAPPTSVSRAICAVAELLISIVSKTVLPVPATLTLFTLLENVSVTTLKFLFSFTLLIIIIMIIITIKYHVVDDRA